MSFLDLCKQRFSVRSYSAEPVSESQLEYILECARLAPSAVNLQPWRFIVVKSEAVRQQVQSCYKREWIAQAPLYIICVVRHQEEWHICMAAAEQGLGSCRVCNFDAARLHELLGLEPDEEASVIVPIGHPAAELEVPEKKRKEREAIISEL